MKIVSALCQRLIDAGLILKHQGKVRDTFEIPGYPDLLLVVASDRISIHDFVLSARVPFKGEILTAMTVFWQGNLFGRPDYCLVPSHIVDYGHKIAKYLPEPLQGDKELQMRALVVRRLKMVNAELIVRGYLSGSGWKAYRETAPNHVLCGHALPSGLNDGSKLPYPLFTPTTKAKMGHDKHMTVAEFRTRFGAQPDLEQIAIEFYNDACAIAAARGVIIADTKMEFGYDGSFIKLGDEFFTPDSSRFWSRDGWEKAQGQKKSPPGWDKQSARDWGTLVGIGKRSPELPEDVAWVSRQIVPPQILEETMRLYFEIFEKLTGVTLGDFHSQIMRIF